MTATTEADFKQVYTSQGINTTDCFTPACTTLSSAIPQTSSAVLLSDPSSSISAPTDSQVAATPLPYAIGSSLAPNSSLLITMNDITTSSFTAPSPPASLGGTFPPDDPPIQSDVATLSTHGPPLITGTNSLSDLSVSTTSSLLESTTTSVFTENDSTLSTANLSPTASMTGSASTPAANEGMKHRGKARLYILGMAMIVMYVNSML